MSAAMGDRDEVILSEWERERFADIEKGLAGSGPHHSRHLVGFRSVRFPMPTVVAVVLVTGGGAMAMATFTRSLWVAAAGLAVMGIGIGLGVNPALVALRRLAANRQTHRQLPG